MDRAAGHRAVIFSSNSLLRRREVWSCVVVGGSRAPGGFVLPARHWTQGFPSCVRGNHGEVKRSRRRPGETPGTVGLAAGRRVVRLFVMLGVAVKNESARY
jgi:hypothetical protein